MHTTTTCTLSSSICNIVFVSSFFSIRMLSLKHSDNNNNNGNAFIYKILYFLILFPFISIEKDIYLLHELKISNKQRVTEFVPMLQNRHKRDSVKS